MGSSYGLQTSNQYFNAPQRLNTGKNLLSGFNAVSAINQQRAANELESERLKLDEKKATSKEARETNLLEIKQDDAAREKATAIFDAWATYLPIDEADPEGSAAALAQGVPVLEKSIQEEFGGKVPASISQHIQALKGGEPGAVLEGLQQYRREKKLAPQPETPEYGSQFQAVGQDGQPGFYRVNKQTGQPEQIPGIQPPPKSGELIEMTGPDGQTMRVRRGVGATDAGIKDPVFRRDVTKKLFNSTEQLRRLDAIGVDVKDRPELMNFWHRAAVKAKSIGKRLGKDVSKEDKRRMEELRSFQRKAIENINSYIKEITGAQMSEKEADRIRLVMPDPGEGVWPAESYDEFMAALNDAKAQARLAIARHQYLLKNGLNDASIGNLMETGDIEERMSLPTMRDVMARRQDEIVKLNPDISDGELVRQLRAEFYGQ